MATSRNNNCTSCGCTDTYVTTQPCPPSCPEVFNSQCIVYTGTDITCNADIVIARYDYLDTVITKLVNYICNVQAPITTVIGSTYIDVVPNTIGSTTSYTVSVDIPALQAYFDTVIAQTIAASFFEGPGIDVAINPITNAVTISHQDTSSVVNLNSDNSGNSFIQDIFFAFDTFGHVTGASVIPGTVTPSNDFDRAQINPDSGFVWGPNNDPTNIQIAEAPGDTLNFVAGTGIVLNASTVTGTDAIRITNNAPDQTVVLNEGAGIDVTGTYPNFTITNTQSAVTLSSAGGTESLINDGTGPVLATKGLTAGAGITLTGTVNDITIASTASAVTLASAGGIQTLVNDGTGPVLATKGLTAGRGIVLGSDAVSVTVNAVLNKAISGALTNNQTITHDLNTVNIVVAVAQAVGPPASAFIHGVDYLYTISNNNQIFISETSPGSLGTYVVTMIG